MNQSEAVIASSGSQSGAIDLQHFLLCGVIMPASWTTADLTFLGSADDFGDPEGTWSPIYDQYGNEFTVTAAASQVIQIDPAGFAGVRHVKVRSGTSGTPVNQAAERTLTLVLRAG